MEYALYAAPSLALVIFQPSNQQVTRYLSVYEMCRYGHHIEVFSVRLQDIKVHIGSEVAISSARGGCHFADGNLVIAGACCFWDTKCCELPVGREFHMSCGFKLHFHRSGSRS